MTSGTYPEKNEETKKNLLKFIYFIYFHRVKRLKGIKKSALDQINGVGSMRKKALLNHFGSARLVESASLDDIKSVEGIEEKIAKRIHEFFHE